MKKTRQGFCARQCLGEVITWCKIRKTDLTKGSQTVMEVIYVADGMPGRVHDAA